MKSKKLLAISIAAILACTGIGAWLWDRGGFHFDEVTSIVDVPPSLDLLVDDRLEDKNPEFDPDLIDSRLMESYDESQWEINASAAVLKLDIRENRTDRPLLNKLYASYADAARVLEKNHQGEILPSVNSIDGAAKQFDDGMMAAITLAMVNGGHEALPDVVALLRHALGLAGGKPAAHAWLSLALSLGGNLEEKKVADFDSKQRSRADEFPRSAAAKPIGFFTWSAGLEQSWVLLKFLQQRLEPLEARQLSELFRRDAELKGRYSELLEIVGKLSNPARKSGLLQTDGEVFLPPVGMKEDLLFDRLFGNSGVPAGTGLMLELVRAIRSGKVDLKPRENGGWYDHQVYALETFLLPERGAESVRLLLTKKYKQRMLEAFKAMVTVRRELHSGWAYPLAKSAVMPDKVEPRLRLEPSPTYYLRMARSYSFISGILQTVLDGNGNDGLVGLRESGWRSSSLRDELHLMTRRFYGLHLISCEDIGMRSQLLPDETVDRARATREALEYLENWRMDPDMNVDVRVSTPVLVQPNGYRLWCQLGVRPALLQVSYARPPVMRQKDGGPDWTEATGGSKRYLILVNEFAEVHAPFPLNRKELRDVCDTHGTKKEILKALDIRR